MNQLINDSQYPRQVRSLIHKKVIHFSWSVLAFVLSGIFFILATNTGNIFAIVFISFALLASFKFFQVTLEKLLSTIVITDISDNMLEIKLEHKQYEEINRMFNDIIEKFNEPSLKKVGGANPLNTNVQPNEHRKGRSPIKRLDIKAFRNTPFNWLPKTNPGSD